DLVLQGAEHSGDTRHQTTDDVLTDIDQPVTRIRQQVLDRGRQVLEPGHHGVDPVLHGSDSTVEPSLELTGQRPEPRQNRLDSLHSVLEETFDVLPVLSYQRDHETEGTADDRNDQAPVPFNEADHIADDRREETVNEVPDIHDDLDDVVPQTNPEITERSRVIPQVNERGN